MSLTPHQKRVKKKWVDAMESGKYTQTTGVLYNERTAGFCCLGVLQHVTMNGCVEADEVFSGAFDDGISAKELEPGSMPTDKFYTYVTGLKWVKDNASKLAEMNDDERKDFKQIAQFVRENWK